MPVSITIKDITPQWLKFYELAKDADPEQRWELWQEYYHFAALPPTDRFLTEARKLLDASWHRYPEALEAIRAGAGGFRPSPQASLEAVCRALDFDGDLTVQFVAYVGNFEGNAFAFTMGGIPVVNFPVEDATLLDRPVALAHEFTHIVHHRLCGSEGYVKPIAFLAMSEGLAMHTSRVLVPGHPDSVYLHDFTPNWTERCRAKHREILTGMRPYLAERSAEAMWRFTMGAGTTGLEREAYHTGWHVVDRLLADGCTLGELARLPEAEVIPLVDRTIAELLA